MKKVKYFIVACLSIALLSYGVIAFANGGTSADSKEISHGDVTGKFVSMIDGNRTIKLELENGVNTYTLDGSVWIFRDQKKTTLENLKTGDKIELILNPNQKVAYIKAYSKVYLKAAAVTVSASTPIPTAVPTVEPTPTATPKSSAAVTITSRITIATDDNSEKMEKKEHNFKKHGKDHNNGNDDNDNNDNNEDNHHDNRNQHDGNREDD
jgi:Cu/Ag efflux protein CusF